MVSSLLNIGSSALLAAQGTLATISHNVANVNTPGYSRQEAQLATAGGLSTGAGFFGRGVDLTTVRRLYDQFLTGAVQSATAASAADSARSTGLQALDAIFADGELGTGAAVDDLFAAAGDLANRPGDLSVRQAFLARADQLVQRLTRTGSQVSELASAADGRLAQDATQVNARLADIARLNAQIGQGMAGGHTPNDLLDQRDAALQALDGYIEVHVLPQDDGTVSLFTGSGAPLLVGTQVARLDTAADPADASRLALRLTVGSQSQWLQADTLGGGSLAGTLRLRDGDLASAVNQLGRLAQVVSSAFNRQQTLGVDMDGNPGAALFSVPGPASVPNSANTGGATLAAAVSDATALRPSDYDVAWDGTAFTITRLSDGQASTAAALPATIDGLSFSASGVPAAGDRWRVRPFAAAATGLAARPLSPRQLATGFAAAVESAAGNRGGAVATDFQVLRVTADSRLPVTITFNDPPTSFNVTGLASGDLSNVAYTPGQRVPAAPADYNGWAFTLDGVPVAGDSFNVRAMPSPGTDNRNALALGQLADAGLVAGATLNEAYAALLGDVGSRVQSGREASDLSDRLASEAVARQQNVAGVNLDEEAANLMRFQQAYQASAKIIQASQNLFEALLSATGG